MTLGDVTAQLNLVPTGVIYYFKNKEELAAAAFLRAIAAEDEAAAAAEPRRFLPVGEAAARVLGRITGEEARPNTAPVLRAAAARASVPRRRSK